MTRGIQEEETRLANIAGPKLGNAPGAKAFWERRISQHQTWEMRFKSRKGGPVPGFAGLRMFLEELKDGRMSPAKGVRGLAQRVAKLVREEYRKQSRGAPEPTGLSKQIKEMGKDKGAVNPARLPEPQVSTLYMLSMCVIEEKTSTGWLIHIDPAAISPHSNNQYPAGQPMGLVAHFLENPQPYIKIPVSLRAMGYFMTLRRGEGGYGKRKSTRASLPDQNIGQVNIITPKQYPVWETVSKELIKLLKDFYEVEVEQDLRRTAIKFGLI